jgi:hypothetical protein
MPFTNHRLSSLLLGSVWLVLTASVGSAQTTVGRVVGVATDSSGAALPGTVVTVSGPALLRGQETTTTAADGAYRFATLPPGDYSLVFELAGFQTVKREGVRVEASQTYAVDVQMQVGRVEQSVEVVAGAPLIDIKGAQVGHTVGSEVIATLPIARRFSDLLNTLPGVTDGLYSFSPVNTVYGSSVRENVYMVDGLNFVDPLVGTPVTDVPFDDIQEARVTTAGFSVSNGQASGGIFNFVTKAGGNSFTGIGNFHFQNKSLQWSNISNDLRRQGVASATSNDHVYDWGGNLGGPIVRNRVSFFQSYHNFDQAQSRTEFPHPITVTQWQTLSKLTAQVSPRNRVEATYTRRSREFLPFNASFATSQNPQSWIAIGWKNDVAGFAWNSVVGEGTLIDVRGGLTRFTLTPGNPFVQPGVPSYQDSATGLIVSGTTNNQANNQRDNYEAKAEITHYRSNWGYGSHNFKAGFHLSELRASTRFEDPAGTHDTHLVLFNSAPFRVRLWNTPLIQRMGIRRTAGYLEDEWSISKRLTITPGVRIENANGFLPQSELFGGTWSTARTFPAQSDVFNPTGVAPRFGTVWDLTGDHRSTVSFSAGRFYTGPTGQELYFATPAAAGFREFDWADRNGDRLYQPGEEGILRSDTTGTLPGLIDPNLKMPYTNMVTVGIHREVAKNLAVAVNVIYKNEHNIIETADANIPFSAYNAIQVVNPIASSPLTIYTRRAAFVGLPTQRFVTNPSTPIPIRRYKGVEFVATKRMSGRWQMQASYNLGKAESHLGTLFLDTSGNSGLYNNPNALVNAFGPTSLDRTHMLKVMGSFDAPHGLTVSAFYSALSGLPWLVNQSGGSGVNGARIVRFFRTTNPAILTETFIDVAVEPRGTNRFEAERKLDLRLTKTVKVARLGFDLQADVFNVFNANTVIQLQSLRTDAPNFLLPAQIMFPRAARLGVRMHF